MNGEELYAAILLVGRYFNNEVGLLYDISNFQKVNIKEDTENEKKNFRQGKFLQRRKKLQALLKKRIPQEKQKSRLDYGQ